MAIGLWRAAPMGVGGLADVVKSPAYSTAVGLVKYGASRLRTAKLEQQRRPTRPPRVGVGSRVSGWLREVF